MIIFGLILCFGTSLGVMVQLNRIADALELRNKREMQRGGKQ